MLAPLAPFPPAQPGGSNVLPFPGAAPVPGGAPGMPPGGGAAPPLGGAPQPLTMPLPPQQQTSQAPTALQVVGKETGKGDKSEPADGGGLPGHKLYSRYQSYYTAKSGERDERLAAWRYVHGKQWTEEQVRVLKQRKQLPTYYNRIRRKIGFLVGTEQRLRRDPQASANHPKWDGSATAITHALRYVHNKSKAPAQISLAVLDYFVTGIAVLHQGVATVGKNTDPTKLHVPADRFFYDPRSRKHDFSDAKFLGIWDWLEVETAAEMMEAFAGPEAAETVRGLSGLHAAGDPLVPSENGLANAWVDPETDSVRLVEMYYRYRGQWRLCFLVGQVVIADKPSIFLHADGTSRHAFNATTCYVDEEGDRYGIVRDMIPVQDQINHRLSKLLHLMSTRQLAYETGAFKDPAKAHREFMKADGSIEFNPGALKDKRFEVLENSQEIQYQAELLQSAIAEIDNVGPNPGLVGRGEGMAGSSGRAILAQQNAGMTELSPEFERIREFKLHGYEIDWGSIRQFWTGERMVRITDGKGAEFIGLNVVKLDPMTGAVSVDNPVAEVDVDVILDEGPDVIVVREELLQTFKDMGEAALGPLGQIFLELSNLPDKDRLIDMIKNATAPNPEVVEMQKRMAGLEATLKELQGKKIEADIASEHADTENKRADTLVKLAPLLIQPQQVPQFFPMPFTDEGFPAQPAPAGGPPALGAPPMGMGAPPPAGGPPGAPVGQGGPIRSPVSDMPVAQPGDDPKFGQPGTLPAPPPGLLPNQPDQGGAVNGFAAKLPH